MGGVVSAASVVCLPCTAIMCGFNFLSCCCTGSMGPNGVKSYQAKVFYVFLLAGGTLLGFLFGELGARDADNRGGFLEDLLCDQVDCDAQPAILRVSLASVVFFSLMLLGTVPVPTLKGDDNWRPLLGEGFHRGFWGAKFVVYFGLIVGFFFLSIDETAFINVARIVSAIFLVVQVLVLVDFAYIWDETWVERSDVENDYADGSKCWLITLIGLAVLLYIAAFGGFIALLALHVGCTSTQAIAATNMVASIIFIALTLLKSYFIEDEVGGSIAPPAVVAAYVSFLSFSATQSNPDVSDECDPFGTGGEPSSLEIFLSIIIATISLVWMALTVSSNASSLLGGGGGKEQAAPEVGGAYEVEEADGTTKYAADGGNGDDDGEDTAEAKGDKLWFFHAVMITASFYMSMILTNWGVDSSSTENDGNVSMYSKAAASWLACIIFTWTVIAPAVMPDRDW